MSKQKYPQTASVSTTAGGATRTKRKSYSHAKADAKKARKRREAEDRNFKYECLSTAEKLKGLGPTGSNRQRKRLEALLADEKAAKAAAKKAKEVAAK